MSSLSPLDRATTDFLEAKGLLSAKSVTYYALTLKSFAASYPNWPPKADDLNKFLLAAKRRGCKASTIHDYYRALRAWLNWLHERGRLEQNPMPLVEKPAKPRLLPRAPQEETLTKLFDHLRILAHDGRGHWTDVRDLAVWALAFDTGLRIGEIVALDPEDITINDKQRSAFINGQKTHFDRVVVFSPACAKVLLDWIQVRSGLGQLEDNPLPKEEVSLFVSFQRGKWGRMTDGGFRQALKKLCKEELGIPHVNPHKMRHGYATYYLRHGGGLNDVQAQLGHASITTTARYVMADDIGRADRHKGFSPLARLLEGEGI